MPKYRNNQAFIQPVVIAGKRYIVKSGEVISSERELDLSIYTFLTLAEDTATISPITHAPQREIPNVAKNNDLIELRKKVDTVFSLLSSLVKHDDIKNVVTHEELNKKLTIVTQSILEQTPQIEQEEFNIIVDRVEQLKKLYETINENEEIKALVTVVHDIKDNQEKIFKRLEIIKGAVNIIDQALHNLENEVYLNGTIVITDADEENK